MSRSHRKALKLLLVMALFEENGFVSGIRETVFEIIDAYQKESRDLSTGAYEEIIGYGKVVEKMLAELNYKTTPQMMSYLLMAVCEHFSQHTKNYKREKWIKLNKLVALPYTSVEEADKAAEVADILIDNA